MPDLEKVIAGLECCQTKEGTSYTECEAGGCPYRYEGVDCMTKLHQNALALLQEQEPRVMTMEEVEAYKGFVWVEFQSRTAARNTTLSLECVTVRATDNFPDSFILATDSGIAWTRDRCDYNAGIWFGTNSGWRCWTARPTDEQRKAVAWDE